MAGMLSPNGSPPAVDMYTEFMKKNERRPSDEAADSPDKPKSSSNNLIVHENENEAAMSNEELNRRVEAFITKINHEIRLERQKSQENP